MVFVFIEISFWKVKLWIYLALYLIMENGNQNVGNYGTIQKIRDGQRGGEARRFCYISLRIFSLVKLRTQTALSSIFSTLWNYQNEKYRWNFVPTNGKNIITIKHLLTSCFHFQYILGIVGITKNKKAVM